MTHDNYTTKSSGVMVAALPNKGGDSKEKD